MTARLDLARLVSESGESFAQGSAALAGRRLGIAAALVGGFHAIYTLLYRTVWVAASSQIGTVLGVCGIAISAGVSLYLLGAKRSAVQTTRVAVSYEIYLALSLAVSESMAMRHDQPSAQVSWSTITIVLFPFLIPAPPRVVLTAAAVSAAMTPLGMAFCFSLTGRSWPPPGITASYVLPSFLCALLAWAPVRAISQMTAAVRQARLVGNYELTERLGAGGMGEVWRAKHRLLARPAAVKLIQPEVLGASDARSRELLLRRFEREAQVTANLESPNTVELYDFGVSADGSLFYVMELLQGVDLETLVDRFGALPSERVIHFLLQACDSLADAHARGLIHRDVKPANLFVCRKGTTLDVIKLLDFGLVKRWQPEPGKQLHALQLSATLPHAGSAQIVGTPAFLAPEAALGEQSVDHRADLYALGCVAYWMLTGELVFKETSAVAMAVAHVMQTPDPLSTRAPLPVEPELEAIVMSCLAKNRDQRPNSAEALRAALAALKIEPWSRERAGAWWRQHLPEHAGSPL